MELNFSAQASSSSAVGSPSQGCPVNLDRGVAFIGGGFVRFPAGTLSSSVFSANFELRTTHNRGLVLFAYGSENNATSALSLDIRGNFLTLVATVGGIQLTSVINSVPVCDGEWHSIIIDQNRADLSVTVDLITAAITLPSSNIVFSSSLYLGGVDMDAAGFTLAEAIGLNVYTPFSGCLRYSSDSLVVDNTITSLVVEQAQFVRYDGCGSSPMGQCVAAWEEQDAGQAMAITDVGLTAFSSE